MVRQKSTEKTRNIPFLSRSFPKEEERSNLTTKECLIIIGTILISCAALIALYKFKNPQLASIANKELKQSLGKGVIALSGLIKTVQTLPNINDSGKSKLFEMLLQAQSKEKILWKGIKDGFYFWSKSLNKVYIS